MVKEMIEQRRDILNIAHVFYKRTAQSYLVYEQNRKVQTQLGVFHHQHMYTKI